MILLDTNIVSGLMAPSPPERLVSWLNGQSTETLFLSAITIAEISYQLRILPAGRRRTSLRERFGEFVAAGFAQRVLDFDVRAAAEYGEILAHRREIGRPMSLLDGQIAATARAYSLAVATRHLSDFEDCGLALVDPFQESG